MKFKMYAAVIQKYKTFNFYNNYNGKNRWNNVSSFFF